MISECRMCALTGSLGAGKTTLVDVIACGRHRFDIASAIEDFVLRACSNFIPLEGSQNSDPGETTHEDPNCV